MSDWFALPMYHIKYIFVNIVYHSYGIVFIAVNIKNIVNMGNNKQFVITHACRSYTYSNCCTLTYRLCHLVSDKLIEFSVFHCL